MGTTGTARTFAPAGAGPLAVGAVRIVGGGLLLLVLALRRGALRGLVTTGTRTRCLIALGAVAVVVYQAAFFAATARTGVAIGTVPDRSRVRRSCRSGYWLGDLGLAHRRRPGPGHKPKYGPAARSRMRKSQGDALQ